MGRSLILLGVLFIGAGLLVSLGGRFTGRVPGDIVIRRNNFTFYFPLATSLLLSILLTAVLWLFNRR